MAASEAQLNDLDRDMESPSANNAKSDLGLRVAKLIIAAAAVFATLSVANHTLAADRKLTMDGERLRAYSAYIETHVEFNEFIWANLYWAGTDTGYSDADLHSDFWADAARMQSALESRYIVARMISDDPDVRASLKALREGEYVTFVRFKCMSGLPGECYELGPEVTPSTNEEVRSMLRLWTEETQVIKRELEEFARESIN